MLLVVICADDRPLQPALLQGCEEHPSYPLMSCVIKAPRCCWPQLVVTSLSSQAVSTVGKHWQEVPRRVPRRTNKQCRKRYVNVLDPELRLYSEWNLEEMSTQELCQ